MNAALMFLLISDGLVKYDTAACVEINHVWDEFGCVRLSQCIWWDKDQHVIAWRLLDKKHAPARHKEGWRQTFIDRNDVMRVIDSRMMRETWSMHDPEVDDRKYRSEQLRPGLSGEKR